MGQKKKTEELEVIQADSQLSKTETGQFDIQETSAERLMVQAIANNVPVETIERLMAMRRELKAEWALGQYNKAMAAFQAECPVIQKRKTARDDVKGKDLYKFAPLDDISEQTKELRAKHGFSHTFRQSNDGDKLRITCVVAHKDGHIDDSSYMETGLATKTPIMSGPQQIASTVTFNKRYAFCNAFGIMTGDEDVDAAKAVVEPQEEVQRPKKEKQGAPKQKFINKEQATEINGLIKKLGIKKKEALKEMGEVIEREIKEFNRLTEEEASAIISNFKARPTEEPEVATVYPKPIVIENASITASANKEEVKQSYTERAMNCKNQVEAESIMLDMQSTNESEAVKEMVRGMLYRVGWNV